MGGVCALKARHHHHGAVLPAPMHSCRMHPAVQVHVLEDSHAEAEYIAREIKGMLHRWAGGVRYRGQRHAPCPTRLHIGTAAGSCLPARPALPP